MFTKCFGACFPSQEKRGVKLRAEKYMRLQSLAMASAIRKYGGRALPALNTTSNTVASFKCPSEDSKQSIRQPSGSTKEGSAGSSDLSQNDQGEEPSSLVEAQTVIRIAHDKVTILPHDSSTSDALANSPLPASPSASSYRLELYMPGEYRPQPQPQVKKPKIYPFRVPCQLGSQRRFFSIPNLFKISPNPQILAKVIDDPLKMFELSWKLKMPNSIRFHFCEEWGYCTEKLVMCLWGISNFTLVKTTANSNCSYGVDDLNMNNTFQVFVPSLKCGIVGLAYGRGEFGNDISAYVSKYLPGCLINKLTRAWGEYVLTTEAIIEAFAEVKAQMIADLKVHRPPGYVKRWFNRCPFLASSATCTIVVATANELIIVQLGTETYAVHVGPSEGTKYAVSKGEGSFSINAKSPCIPGVLRIPVDKSRALGLDAIDMVLIGTREMWMWVRMKELRDIVEKHRRKGSGMCRLITYRALEENYLLPAPLRTKLSVACVALNLAYL